MRRGKKLKQLRKRFKQSLYPMKHISYQSIEQFRTTIKNLQQHFRFEGLDAEGNAIYNYEKQLPTVNFQGTVKLHGTNAAVVFNNRDGLYAQSRENIITPVKDNAGFAFFVESKKDVFLELIEKIRRSYLINSDVYSIVIYGEWAGKSIQKGVAISEIEKSFFIFGVKVTIMDTGNNEDNNFRPHWVDYQGFSSPENKIYNILDYPTYSIDINLNAPELSIDKLVELTEAVEAECPVGKAFGVSGIGEGIVWTYLKERDNVFRFKTKGEKHSASKVKKIVSVDTDKITSAREFADYSVTQNRFDQAIQRVFESEPIDVKKLGDVLRWIQNDILREEVETLSDNGLEPKDVNKFISDKARGMFFELLKDFTK